MARTKGSKNKKVEKVKVLKPLSNFRSMEVKVTRTQLFEVAFTKKDIEELIKIRAKSLSHHADSQLFEEEKVVYDKKGNAFVTLTNPTNVKEVVNKLHESLVKNDAS